MSRPGINDITDEQDETVKKPKRFRFELGLKELVFYSLGMLLALSWMFAFGILIGRGIPLVSSDDISLQGHLMRYLGLGKQADQQPQPQAQESFDSPQKMLQALDYYADLTQSDVPTAPTLRHVPTLPAPPAKQPPAEAPSAKAKAARDQAQPSQEPKNTVPQQASLPEPGPPGTGSEHFTLLVSSLKDAENAQKLVDQLRSKGYSPRIETLNLGGSGRWNRVLIGFFKNREEALRFASEFNRKEHTEGLVIRESH
jgi:cell division septation protein DedD